MNTLRSALDCARTPVDRIEIDPGYLADLMAHELAEEPKLIAQVVAFFVSVRQRSGRASEFASGFENPWTAGARDIEAAPPIN